MEIKKLRLRREWMPKHDRGSGLIIPQEFLDYCGLDGEIEVIGSDGKIVVRLKPDPQIAKNEAMLKRTQPGWRSSRGKVMLD